MISSVVVVAVIAGSTICTWYATRGGQYLVVVGVVLLVLVLVLVLVMGVVRAVGVVVMVVMLMVLVMAAVVVLPSLALLLMLVLLSSCHRGDKVLGITWDQSCAFCAEPLDCSIATSSAGPCTRI